MINIAKVLCLLNQINLLQQNKRKKKSQKYLVKKSRKRKFKVFSAGLETKDSRKFIINSTIIKRQKYVWLKQILLKGFFGFFLIQIFIKFSIWSQKLYNHNQKNLYMTIKLFNTQNNQIYFKIKDLPLIQQTNSSKQPKKQPFSDYDHLYNFFYQGQKLTANQVQKLFQTKTLSSNMVIVSPKPQNQQSPTQKISYHSHRQVIQHYIRSTKTNDKQKIKQNAEFIFQNAIDGNFKYHTFEFFELEKQFTEERKKKLVNEVFETILKDHSDQISNLEYQGFLEKETNQKDPQNNDSKHKYTSKQPLRLQKKEQSVSQQLEKTQKIVLQLHEMQYITENWKQLLCINKSLLKTNLDNLEYYEQQQKKEKQIQKEKNLDVLEKQQGIFLG